MNPLQKLAKLALDHPELRDDLMPIIREAAYRPKDDWLLLDLAVQDAHKGKPDRQWYKKDEGYTEVYDRTVKELRGRRATDTGAPKTTDIYENEIDHGYDQPLAGGTDVMKRLQDQFLIEQGREPREKNPRLATTTGLQQGLIRVLRSPAGVAVVRDMVQKYAAATGETVVVAAAVEDIMDYAVAVALDPVRVGHVIHKHTAKED